jgi:hypothetical protein
MRNELHLSSKVALDGSSMHVCYFDEEAYLFVLQASENVRKGSCKQTDHLCPADPLRGRGHCIEKAALVASSSFVTSLSAKQERQRP